THTRTVGGDTQTLDWDAEGHLAKVTEGTKTTSYVYDADGNRLIRRTDSETTLYLGGTELTLAKGASTAKATRYYDLGGGNQAIRTDDGKLSFLLGDHHGTSELAVNATDLTMQQRRATPFGAPRGKTPTAWPGQKGFIGGTDDAGTGLTHLGAREYDPSTGRFISVDPVMDTGDPQQMNGYAYSNNNPVTLSDPTGLWWKWVSSAAHAVSDGVSGAWNGTVDATYDFAEGVYTLTDALGWTSHAADTVKNDRAGNSPFSLYNTVTAPKKNSKAYKAGHFIGKTFFPFIPSPAAPEIGLGTAAVKGGSRGLELGFLRNFLSREAPEARIPIFRDVTPQSAPFCSFDRATPVLLENGETKPISRIRTGIGGLDLVPGSDP
ncbi:RHS repeat domain-containing protein, partial [Streptomyces tubercidicus]